MFDQRDVLITNVHLVGVNFHIGLTAYDTFGQNAIFTFLVGTVYH